MTEMPYKGTRLCIEPRGQGRWPLWDAITDTMKKMMMMKMMGVISSAVIQANLPKLSFLKAIINKEL